MSMTCDYCTDRSILLSFNHKVRTRPSEPWYDDMEKRVSPILLLQRQKKEKDGKLKSILILAWLMGCFLITRLTIKHRTAGHKDHICLSFLHFLVDINGIVCLFINTLKKNLIMQVDRRLWDSCWPCRELYCLKDSQMLIRGKKFCKIN